MMLQLLLAAAIAGTERPATLTISDVTLIDGTGAAPRPHVTVRLEDGRIAWIGRAAEAPAASASIDGAGRFLIPGLWDMHAHLTFAGDVACPTLVANGVTGVRDPGGDLAVVDWLRARIVEGMLAGPRIFRAGPFVDGSKPGAADRVVVDTPEAGRRAVALLKRQGVDFIKVHNGAPPEAYFAVLEEARRQGLQVVGHIPLEVDPLRAVEAGHGSIEHIVSLFEGPFQQKVKAGRTQEQAMAEFTDEDAAALARAMAARGTWFDPTLIAYRMRHSRLNAPAVDDPRYKYASASLRAFWKFFSPLPDTPDVRSRLDRAWERFLEITRIVRRERVRFLVGTDLGGVNIYPGFSVHEELQWLVRAGFTPLEALTAATRNSAASLGRLQELGTVEVGKRADLVLLEADPLADIANTARIAAVVADGRPYTKLQIEAMLEAVAAQAPSR
ncbi:MAG TPA: amidohydrolase family protein [Vicinamibacteria bacterium]|nr:amidohydrolase family protein [Vicinamibacteria bacterium]